MTCGGLRAERAHLERWDETAKVEFDRALLNELASLRFIEAHYHVAMGLGAQLLRAVLELAAKMADELGCAGVVVDAKPGAVECYAK